MNIEEFTVELDAKLASMSDQDLIQALKKAGCIFEDEPLNPCWDGDLEPILEEAWGYGPANSNVLALAA